MDKEQCAICKRMTTRYRWVYKQRSGLADGFYRPRLSEVELFKLPEGLQSVCVDRVRCQREQIKQ